MSCIDAFPNGHIPATWNYGFENFMLQLYLKGKFNLIFTSLQNPHELLNLSIECVKHSWKQLSSFSSGFKKQLHEFWLLQMYDMWANIFDLENE